MAAYCESQQRGGHYCLRSQAARSAANPAPLQTFAPATPPMQQYNRRAQQHTFTPPTSPLKNRGGVSGYSHSRQGGQSELGPGQRFAPRTPPTSTRPNQGGITESPSSSSGSSSISSSPSSTTRATRGTSGSKQGGAVSNFENVMVWLDEQSCGGTVKRKRRISRPQRLAANMRERRRMIHLNTAFEHLRRTIPMFPYEKKFSRIQTLTMAIDYIALMTSMLQGNEGQLGSTTTDTDCRMDGRTTTDTDCPMDGGTTPTDASHHSTLPLPATCAQTAVYTEQLHTVPYMHTDSQSSWYYL
jgi:hypothetical protein